MPEQPHNSEASQEIVAPNRKPRIRWWLAGTLTITGVLLIGLGDSFAHGFIAKGEADKGYWSGVSVNIGTTLLLAAALVLFERALVYTTQRVVRRETEPLRIEAERNASETQRLSDATVAFEARLSALDDQMAARAADLMREQTDAIDAISRNVTRENVLNLMRRVTAAGAIGQADYEGSGRIIVVGGQTLAAPLISAEYYPAREEQQDEDRPERLVLAFGTDWQHPEIEWLDGMSAVEVFMGLEEEMISKRDGGLFVRELSVENFFANLRASLDLAYRRRRGHGDFWIKGSPVFEMVSPGWVITERGIEVEGIGVVVSANQFGHNVGEPFSRTYVQRAIPEPAAEFDRALWNVSVSRAAAYFEESPDVWQ
jgi:hypothetical protein